MLQAEEARVREVAGKIDERNSSVTELRAQLEADAATLRKAQKAADTERAIQKVHFASASHCWTQQRQDGSFL